MFILIRRALAASGLVLLLSLMAASQSSKDRAIVIGIDDYPQLSEHLQGCSNDADEMAAELQRRGFQTTVLKGSQATRAGVLAALSQLGSGDNLVFYFAGLGSGPGTPRLLTSDCASGGKPSVTLEELDDKIAALPYKSKTVVLDAGFTPYREGKDGPALYQYRFHASEAKARELMPKATASDLPKVSHDKVCYITASRFNEVAFEDSVEGKPHGVFTYYLCQNLKSAENAQWRSVQWDVSAKVSQHLEDLQHPNFPNSHLASAVFKSGGGAGNLASALTARYGTEGGQFAASPSSASSPSATPRAPGLKSVWDLYNIDNVNEDAITLTVQPNTCEVKVKQPLRFEARAGKSGYLLLVEHDTEGDLRLIYPLDGRLESAGIGAGGVVVIPSAGYTAYADKPGNERLKAFLFDNRGMAQAIIDGLRTDTSVGASFGRVTKGMKNRSIQIVPDTQGANSNGAIALGSSKDPFFTADLTFTVVR